MSTARRYATKRQGIIEALVDAAKTIDGTGDFNHDLGDNVHPILLFWDEVEEFPAIHFNAGTETIEYQGAGLKDRYLSVTARCYVQEENAALALDALLEDLESVIEKNSALKFFDRKGAEQSTKNITVISIDTDEGVLEPIGVGEMLLQVLY